MFLIEVINYEEGQYKFKCNNKNFLVKSAWQNGNKMFHGLINGSVVTIKIKKNNLTGDYLFQHAGCDTYVSVFSPRVAELKEFMPKIEKNPKPKYLKSPITGKIVKFKVKQGQSVKAGQDIVCIEAMKMENVIMSDHDIVIEKIHFNDGDNIGVGQILVDFKK